MKTETDILTTIRVLEERLLQPDVRRSADELSALLADGFVEFGSSGNIFDKSYVVDNLPKSKTVQWIMSDFEARILAPGLVLATYYATKKESNGQISNSWRSSVWKLIDNKWQMIFHQGTPVPREPLV